MTLRRVNKFIIENFIDDVSLCDTIIEWFHSGEVQYKSGTTTGGVKPDIKQSSDIFISTNTDYYWLPNYLLQLKKSVELYCDKFPACKWYGNAGIEEGFNIQWYKPKEGYFNCILYAVAKPTIPPPTTPISYCLFFTNNNYLISVKTLEILNPK